ncbi:hypothetical protein XENOCAPTIV_027529 [Xenoophorus captivus]|uniref:60S ribosomal protein L34 n=1 Tax=Xenoophorus captivus TaxID=1517983 RepID=A0ABV0RAJ2_9TELE
MEYPCLRSAQVRSRKTAPGGFRTGKVSTKVPTKSVFFCKQEQIYRMVSKLYRKGKTLRQRSAGTVSSYTAKLRSLMSYTCPSPAPPGSRTWWWKKVSSR